MNVKSIGFRLAAWYLAVLFAGMLLFGVGTWFALREALWSHLDETLQARTQAVGQFLEQETRGETLDALREETREFASGLPLDQGIRVTTESGDVLFERGLSQKESLHETQTDVHVKGRLLHVEMATPANSLYETLDLLRNILLGSIPVMLLVAGFGGWWLSRRALQPVDEMTSAAETLSIDDISARLAVPKTGDELQRLGEAWNRMLDRIADSVDRMTRFTMDAAHELRTPAAIMQSSAELALRRPRTAEEYRDVIRNLAEESQHLSGLVEDLLQLARSDAGVHRSPEEVPVSDIVSGAVQMIEPLAAAKHQSLSLREGNPEARILGDATSLRRLVLILLDNAIKFSPDGGGIDVRTSSTDDTAQFEVHDDGPGIPAEDLPHIFERFYRSSTARNGPGAGLGLAIAKAIVEEHGGEISIDSAARGGTTVRVTLPLSSVPEPQYQ